MSEALEHVRQGCAEFDAANPGWREDALERKARTSEKQTRELAEARKAREAEKQQVASTNWWTAIDQRIEQWGRRA